MSNEAPTNPAENAAPPGQTPRAAAPGTPSLAARLLTAIRLLVEIGQKRLAAIQAGQLSTADVQDTGHGFGTFNLSVIVARLRRGLRLAKALEQRVIANAVRIDGPKRAPRPARPRENRPPRGPKLSDRADNAALLARMPTDAEIAAMIRHRPFGLVLNDICADLGIGPGQPQWQALWHQLRGVIATHRGQVKRLFQRAFERASAAQHEVQTGLAPNWTFYASTDPLSATTGPPPAPAAT